MLVKLDHLPKDRDENKKCLKFHHLAMAWYPPKHYKKKTCVKSLFFSDFRPVKVRYNFTNPTTSENKQSLTSELIADTTGFFLRLKKTPVNKSSFFFEKMCCLWISWPHMSQITRGVSLNGGFPQQTHGFSY